MAIEIKAPTFPESVQEGSLATWHKQPGEHVARDELLVDIETDKVVLEVVAPVDGLLAEVFAAEGDTVLSGQLIAKLEEGAAASAAAPAAAAPAASAEPVDEPQINPAAKKLAEERGINIAEVTGSGKGGRIIKEDVLNHQPAAAAPAAAAASAAVALPSELAGAGERVEKRVPMTRMRKRIAERLLEVTQNTASLTTFNEVDMSALMELRKQFKEQFEKTHNGTRLGFMGLFVKAAVEALKRYPSVNASIDGNDIVYHGYQDVGVAVSSERGLVVPVLRNAENMSVADIEHGVYQYAIKAREGKLSIEEMSGGTFTITNGGVFGSLLSTPIINPPQTAILGMHKIQDRPVAINGEVVIRPMMYLALSYDHRLIDGKEAVQFLVAIKEMIENPAKILLEI